MTYPQRVLLAGWFSFPDSNATFGDVQAMEVVAEWLRQKEMPFDVAGADVQGVDITSVDPGCYNTLIFVCGPWGRRPAILSRFGHCRMIGIDLSLSAAPHGFDRVFPRDSAWECNPDIVFAAPARRVPVIGVALVHPQPMYGVRQRHERVKEAVDSYLASSDAAVVRLDTLIRDNDTGIKSAAQLEALIRSCDAVVTSRLHGMVYSLRNGVPVVVIDAVAGGAKVTAQARTLGWPLLLDGDAITPSMIAAAVLQAMEHGSRELAYSVAESARERIDALRAAVLDDITLHMSLA